MELEQTVVEVNGKKIDLSKIENERVVQALGDMHATTSVGWPNYAQHIDDYLCSMGPDHEDHYYKDHKR